MEASKIRDFIVKLITLTNEDKLLWERSFPSIHRCQFQSFLIYTEFPQDDRPMLQINKQIIEGYDIGIQQLISTVEQQYRRRGLYEYSAERKKAEEDRKKKEVEEQAKAAVALEQEIANFLTESEKT